MKQFEVEITETLKKTVIVEAENEENALRIVDNNYKAAQDDYVLDAENFVDVSFKVKS
jgi:hypothetical protein